MKILALDLATNCGYAYNDGEDYQCGTWHLEFKSEARKRNMSRRLDPRVIDLFNRVQDLQTRFKFNVITFEDVQFASSLYQVQLWSSLRAAMWTGAFKQNPIFDAVPVATLKLFATSNGRATKEMMVRALIRADSKNFFPHKDPTKAWWQPPVIRSRIEIDDNAVDAIWLWRRATTLFNR